MYTVPQNLALNVNLSYCLDLMTLASKLFGHFSTDLKAHFKVIQAIITTVTFSSFSCSYCFQLH